MELERTHTMPIKGDVTVYDALYAQIPTLRYDEHFRQRRKTSSDFLLSFYNRDFRELSALHMEALTKFKRTAPHLEFPALHKELFSVDS